MYICIRVNPDSLDSEKLHSLVTKLTGPSDCQNVQYQPLAELSLVCQCKPYDFKDYITEKKIRCIGQREQVHIILKALFERRFFDMHPLVRGKRAFSSNKENMWVPSHKRQRVLDSEMSRIKE